MIRFLSPLWLSALLPVAGLACAYVWRQRHRAATAMRFGNLDLLRELVPRGLGWRRHLAAITFLIGLTGSVLALAGPVTTMRVPTERATVILAIDVSLSMDATDVAPTRLAAAQEAAKHFVADLPAKYNLGLISFARSAQVLVPPGTDRQTAITAIDSLTLAEATATGEAVFTALDAIRAMPGNDQAGPVPARVLLLSDGYHTYGRPVEDAAAAAVEAGVPVSTVAFGTDEGVVDIAGQSQPVPVDRAALAALAEVTGGHYYEAASTSELKRVYRDMGSSLATRPAPVDLTRHFVAAALVLALLAATFSLLWTPRII